jgi:signal transduction histidine kinase
LLTKKGVNETEPVATVKQDPANEPADRSALHAELTQVAANAVAACSGIACTIEWRSGSQGGITHTPTEPTWRVALNAAFAIAGRQLEHLPASLDSTLLESGQLAPILKERITHGVIVEGVAARLSRGDCRITTLLLVPIGSKSSQLAALARLTGECAHTLVAGDATRVSRDFWMASGAKAKAELATAVREQAAIEDAVARSMKLQPRNRFAGLAAIFAATGSFDEWIVATSVDVGIRVEASSRALAALTQIAPSGTLAECIARGALIVHTPDGSSELDRLFTDFANYVCVPCGGCAIALAASREIEPVMLAALEGLAARLSPIVVGWRLEAEVERLQHLVRSLGLRMFSAVDGERQRIARDLHDHQTQLLTAARIALEADPAQTRAILKQLDESLRKLLREIRPATLGRSSLQEALHYEIQRLADAGICGKLRMPKHAVKLSSPIQELCYQVAREAVSNVIRHSEATRVAISVERRVGQVILRIEDDGKGLVLSIDQSAKRKERAGGIGLAGMAERLELMGGRLRIERLGTLTRLTAEIPEL